jgi:hypothetical protein
MKKLLIILGVVLLSGTDAFAANLNIEESANHNLETCSFIGSKTTEVIAIEKDMLNNANIQDSRLDTINRTGNSRSTVAQAVPPDRGSPDTRGGNPPEGGGTR